MADEYEMPRPSALGEQHIRAFGYIVVYWTSFEALLDAILAARRGLGGRAKPPSAMNFARKRELLRASGRPKGTKRSPAEFEAILDEILDKAEPLAELRDLVIHATWRPGRRPGTISPARAAPAARQRDYTSDDLHDEATGIFVLWDDLYANATRHGVLPAATGTPVNAPPARKKGKARPAAARSRR